MNRNKAIKNIANTDTLWDVVIIGGGASGMGVAVDAASRGYKTLLVEQADFGKGTSSRSTKLVHGGVRYLQQGNVSLVLEALKERGIMKRNAPHLVKDLEFIVPIYDWWEGPFYGIGLKLYDVLAGKEGLGASKFLSKEETLAKIPTVETENLRGGVIYHDGQFDDARLLVNLAQTAHKQGATLLNYTQVTGLLKEDELVKGVVVEDIETGNTYPIKSKTVINATGVFTDRIRKMDDVDVNKIMTSSQGVHIVLDKSFLPGDTAIMVPHTDDGRVLFAVPWHDKIIVGTTDTPVKKYPLEPQAMEEEIEFLLSHTARYLTKDPTLADIKSIFVGLRPLVMEGDSKDTSAISREHKVEVSKSGLVTLAGGKWTTYRKMAEDALDKAVLIGNLPSKKSVTEELQIFGYHHYPEVFNELKIYGSAVPLIRKILDEKPNYSQKLHPDYNHVEGEVIWAVRNEMARTIEDFLARRTRMLFLDVKASLEMAPKVAALMAEALDYDQNWQTEQIKEFEKLAEKYSA